MSHSSQGIHIALSKCPIGDETRYISKLTNVYDGYKSKIKDFLSKKTGYSQQRAEAYLEDLYRPSIYHIYSHFDVAFISLTDNFKFPQRVFEPWFETPEEQNIKSVSYQILSGSVLEAQKCSLTPSKILGLEKHFLKIIQLKINNGLLIGNGDVIYQKCIELIEDTLNSSGITKYILIDSYNWSEITVLAYAETPSEIATALVNIRDLALEDISDEAVKEKIISDSLYAKWKVKHIEKSHLFCESLSYLGVDFSNYSSLDPDIEFISQIEWQVKPGHLAYFVKAFGKDGPLILDTKPDGIFYKNGKTDFLTVEKEPNKLSSNIAIFEKLRAGGELAKHILKIKTQPLFRLSEENLREIKNKKKTNFIGPFNTEEILGGYKIKRGREVNTYLRKLNVSRNTRKKIGKIIYNYNLGIQDPVLFIYFIDLYRLIGMFIDELKDISGKVVETIKSGYIDKELYLHNFGPLKTKYLEDFAQIYIQKIEEALEDRILNNYNYEDINEFSLDVNSSLTGIVSSFDSIIKLYGKCFRDNKGNSIITTINENETVSNKLSVNYNIEHITSPPLVFSTLIKEILNVEQTSYDQGNAENWKDLNNKMREILESNKPQDIYIKDFINDKNFAYFEIDFKKYYLTFFKNTELYVFWHWAYALQCTHMYSSIGCYDEVNFTRELFRLLLLIHAVDHRYISKMTCPIPELRCYWDKHFKRTANLVDKIANSNRTAFDGICDQLDDQIKSSLIALNTPQNSQTSISKEEIYSKMKIKVEADSEEYKGINEFYDHIVNHKMKMLKATGETSIEMTFYNILSSISYHNLNFIKKKFKEINLLRRNYLDGAPIDHFLACEKKWFIDPFGGFFINCVDERKEFMHFNNKMLYLLWHIGIVLKKESF